MAHLILTVNSSTHATSLSLMFPSHLPNLPISGSFELIRVFGSDSLGCQQFSERTIDLDLARHERIKLSRWSGVLCQLFFDNAFNHLTPMSWTNSNKEIEEKIERRQQRRTTQKARESSSSTKQTYQYCRPFQPPRQAPRPHHLGLRQ